MESVYVAEFDERKDVPYNWKSNGISDKSQHCSSGVRDSDYEKLHNLKPLIQNFLNLKLGWNNDLMMDSIIVVF